MDLSKHTDTEILQVALQHLFLGLNNAKNIYGPHKAPAYFDEALDDVKRVQAFLELRREENRKRLRAKLAEKRR